MLKVVLILVILFLLRDKLGLLKPHWYTLVPATLGAIVGYIWACFLARYGALAQIHQQIGISPGLSTLISSAVGAVFVAGQGRPFLRKLFPPNGKGRTDA